MGELKLECQSIDLLNVYTQFKSLFYKSEGMPWTWK